MCMTVHSIVLYNMAPIWYYWVSPIWSDLLRFGQIWSDLVIRVPCRAVRILGHRCGFRGGRHRITYRNVPQGWSQNNVDEETRLISRNCVLSVISPKFTYRSEARLSSKWTATMQVEHIWTLTLVTVVCLVVWIPLPRKPFLLQS